MKNRRDFNAVVVDGGPDNSNSSGDKCRVAKKECSREGRKAMQKIEKWVVPARRLQ
jgi:hypothetical protein